MTTDWGALQRVIEGDVVLPGSADYESVRKPVMARFEHVRPSAVVRAGLVDRFRVVVFPVITGSTGQDRIYDGYPDVALDLVASRTFDGRIQLLEYVPTVLAGPPGTTKADA